MKAYEVRFKRARARAARAAPRELHAMLSHVCDHVTAEHRDAQEGACLQDVEREFVDAQERREAHV